MNKGPHKVMGLLLSKIDLFRVFTINRHCSHLGHMTKTKEITCAG